MWTWLMVKLGYRLRWRAEKPGVGNWTIMVGSRSGQPLIDSTVRQVGKMLRDGWVLVEQPSCKGVPRFGDHPCF